jgi:hypothetical protein
MRDNRLSQVLMRDKLRSNVSQCEGHQCYGHLMDTCRSQLRGHAGGDRALLKGHPLDQSYCIERPWRDLSQETVRHPRETKVAVKGTLAGAPQGVKSRGQVATGGTLNLREAGTVTSKRDRSQ